jgi:hypothetical protein
LESDLALVLNTALLIANSFAPGDAPATAYRDHYSLTCTPSMPRHVPVNREGKFAAFPVRCIIRRNQAIVSGIPASVMNTHRGSPPQRPQSPEVRPVQRMHTLNPALGVVHIHAPMPENDLRPAQLTEISRTKSMPVSQKDRRSIPDAITASLAGGLE